MPKYEPLPTTLIQQNGTMLPAHHLPELVHLDDPALSVMIDFTEIPPHTIDAEDTMAHAITEMEISGAHLLLVIDNTGHFQGVLSSEDVWGEKPIQLIQERRIDRDQVQVKMIMVPLPEITALSYHVIASTQVGHVVKTLSIHRKHYALVIEPNADKSIQIIRGIFTASQIGKQLHHDLSGVIEGTESFK